MKKSIIVLCILLLTGIFALSCSKDADSAGVDVDLSKLSVTMAQAEYENIVTGSGKYIGKTIRATGAYYAMVNENTGDLYHYVIIVQGDECCQLGFEFKRDGEYTVPDDYPERNEAIEVTGILSRGEDRGFPYLYLASAEMTELN